VASPCLLIIVLFFRIGVIVFRNSISHLPSFPLLSSVIPFFLSSSLPKRESIFSEKPQAHDEKGVQRICQKTYAHFVTKVAHPKGMIFV
jgi:hypothetical protein